MRLCFVQAVIQSTLYKMNDILFLYWFLSIFPYSFFLHYFHALFLCCLGMHEIKKLYLLGIFIDREMNCHVSEN